MLDPERGERADERAGGDIADIKARELGAAEVDGEAGVELADQGAGARGGGPDGEGKDLLDDDARGEVGDAEVGVVGADALAGRTGLAGGEAGGAGGDGGGGGRAGGQGGDEDVGELHFGGWVV